MQLNIKTDIERLTSKMVFYRKQIPFATALALTKTAQELKLVQIAEMNRVFANPSPYTINALAVRPATKQKLRSEVFFKEFAGKGTPAFKYLMPNIKGEGRRQKRHEKALQLNGKMTKGGYTIPARNIPLNAYGNLEGKFYRQILSQVGAAGEQNITKTSRTGKKTKSKYFPIAEVGIFERVGKQIRPVLIYIDQPRYKKVYDFYGISRKFYEKNFATYFKESLQKAITSAKSFA